MEELVSGGVFSGVTNPSSLCPLPITHLSSPTDQILARMSGILDLSSEENAKHLLPR